MSTVNGSYTKVDIRSAERKDIPTIAKLLQLAFAEELSPIVDPSPTKEYLEFREQQINRVITQRDLGAPINLDVAIDRQSQNIVGFCTFYSPTTAIERDEAEEKIKDQLPLPKFPSYGNAKKYKYYVDCMDMSSQKYEKEPMNHISFIVIDTNYRGGGVGSLLLKNVYSRNKYPTYLDSVQEAVPFYKKHNFQSVDNVTKIEGDEENAFLPLLDVMIRPGDKEV